MRKAIVLSYHGTREKEKSQKIYDRVQEYFSGKFPEFKIMVTIDSEFVIKKLGEDGEIRLQSTDKALEELYLIGCE
ncbi:MAG: sirohydrochlorin cobaltochelatase, partial [Fusobacteriaceae bacterium]